MKKKIKKIVLGNLLILLFAVSIIYGTTRVKALKTNLDVGTSNKKIEWGIKRNDNHDQPDLGSKNKKLVSKYNGIALGNKDKKYIYLTFDLGYEAGYTDKILDILKENNVQGTFFITAHYLNTAPELVKRMIDEGHIVGNHTVNHKSMPSLKDEEIESEIMNLHHAIYQKYGYEMKYIRPPKGEFSERTLSISEKLGYKTVMWSFAYVDWEENNQPSENDAINKITSNFHNGEVMLLHGTSKTNAVIMNEIIQKAREAGYEWKSIEEYVE